MDLIIKNVEHDSANLAATTAVDVDTTIASFEDPILLTKCKTEVLGPWPVITTNHLMLVLAYGDASISQIASVFTAQIANPENQFDYRLSQVETRAVVDFVALEVPTEINVVKAQHIVWDLPKKGLPSGEGGGFKLVLFNPEGVALNNGPILQLTTKWWLARLSQ